MDTFGVNQPPQNGLPSQAFISSTPLNVRTQTRANPSIIVPAALNNQPQAVHLCCNQVRCENQLLRRALGKEREKRQFISRAYQELLRSYETLLDLKNVIDIPSSSSISLSSSDEQHQTQQNPHEGQQFFTSSAHQQNLQLHPTISQNAIINVPIRMAPPTPMQPPQHQFQQTTISIDNSLENVLLDELQDFTVVAEQNQDRTLPHQIGRHFSSSTMQTQATRTIAHINIPAALNFMGQQLTNDNPSNGADQNFGKTYALTSNSNERFNGIEQQNRENIRRNKSNFADIPRQQQQPQTKTSIAAVAPIRPPPPTMDRGKAPFRQMNMDLADRNINKTTTSKTAIQRQLSTKTARERSTVNFDGEGDDEEEFEENEEMLAEVKARQRQIRKSKSANWYFISFDENDAINGTRKGKDKAAKHHLRNLLVHSRARYNAIVAASRRRASIAANRRTVATDLLKEKRQLDEEAIRVLHTDSSSVSAFPQFMRRMRSASRRTFHKSPVRQQQEEERERLLERATNRILAHSSAAISRVMTRAHIN